MEAYTQPITYAQPVSRAHILENRVMVVNNVTDWSKRIRYL